MFEANVAAEVLGEEIGISEGEVLRLARIIAKVNRPGAVIVRTERVHNALGMPCGRRTWLTGRAANSIRRKVARRWAQ
jgi:hypothetical protein